MPKIYEYLGLIFFFYSNEHLPIHVHVSLAEFELKYEKGKIKDIVVQKVKARKPLPVQETKEAIKFIKRYHEEIVEKWTKFFVQNKRVTCEVVNKKL